MMMNENVKRCEYEEGYDHGRAAALKLMSDDDKKLMQAAKENVALQARIDALEKENAELKVAILEAECFPNSVDDNQCPFCYATNDRGDFIVHHSGCIRARLKAEKAGMI
jgi:hypothetical protein